MSCECPICYEVIYDTNTTTTSCGHKFHTDCIIRSVMSVNNLCPCCRNSLTKIIQPAPRQPGPRQPAPRQPAPRQPAPRQPHLEIRTIETMQQTLDLRSQQRRENIQQIPEHVLIYLASLSSYDLCKLRPLLRERLQTAPTD